MSDKINDTNVAADEEAENALILVFNKPYTFEGETYDSVDLSALEDLTAKDMIAAEKYTRRADPSATVMIEMSTTYAQFLAARAADKPVEFFAGLSPKDIIKLKNLVTGFLYGAD